MNRSIPAVTATGISSEFPRAAKASAKALSFMMSCRGRVLPLPMKEEV